MTRTDTFVVGTLVVLLAIVAGVIGVPALQPTSLASREPEATAAPGTDRPYIEGVIGAPASVSPLTARNQVDRDLVALVFSGLVRNGPAGTLVPDLASHWSVDQTGKTWTVQLRDDATWHDGEPVTAEDVVFTIRTLKDPAYTGPAASSWSEVSVRALSDKTVEFTLETPLGGFLQALTQPIAPAHILGDVPADVLPDHPFGQQPVGSGPFALSKLNGTSATLVPAVAVAPVGEAEPDPSTAPSDSLATPGPPLRPERPIPYLPGIEFRFFDDEDALADAYRTGTLDAVSGISTTLAAELAVQPNSRLLRYPGSTLSAVLLNLRPDHPEFRSPAVRTALLAAIDRGRIIDGAFAGSATAATGPIPAVSPVFDLMADPPVEYDTKAASKGLKDAGWTEKDDGWYPPGATKPLALEVLSPEQAANPGLFAAAAAVVSDWEALGLTAKHVPLPPAEFVTERLAKGAYQVAVADIAIGLDPDLYPLLASSQTLTGGSNVMGIQDPALDTLLAAARAPGTPEARLAAYKALQQQLAKGRYVLPLLFADEVAVVRDTVEGMAVRQVSDPSDRYWDVLTWRLAADR
jgi:peptide/nickel transport system substrate-binding protein